MINAARENNISELQILVAEGSDVNFIGECGGTALMYAADEGPHSDGRIFISSWS
jgi:hypothetical protein